MTEYDDSVTEVPEIRHHATFSALFHIFSVTLYYGGEPGWRVSPFITPVHIPAGVHKG